MSNEEKRKARNDEKDAHNKRQRVCDSIQGTMSVDRERASSEYDAAVERLGRSAGAMTTDALKYYISTLYRTQSDTIETLNDTIETLKDTIQLKSLSGLLALTTEHSTANKLVSKGTATAHLKTKHEEANAIKTIFPLHVVKLIPPAAENCSHVMTTLEGAPITLEYANEYDVHCFVHDALRDAIRIGNLSMPAPLERNAQLSARREGSLFSNKLDHSVVFDAISGDPLFAVETKKPVTVPLSGEKRVIGQVFDQLAAMKAFGHPNPFGAVTTFDSTHIVWIETGTSAKVVEQHTVQEDLSWESVTNRDPSGKQEQATQSPIKMKKADPSTKKKDSPKLSFEAATREVFVSQAFEMHELVPACVNAINCALQGYEKARSIDELSNGQELKRFALELGKNKYTWGLLSTNYIGPYVEPRKRRNTFFDSMKWCIIDFLGNGSTSKAYHALTVDGRDCVVKMYVRKVDDEGILIDKKTYEKNAKAAVKREVDNFRKIYP